MHFCWHFNIILSWQNMAANIILSLVDSCLLATEFCLNNNQKNSEFYWLVISASTMTFHNCIKCVSIMSVVIICQVCLQTEILVSHEKKNCRWKWTADSEVVLSLYYDSTHLGASSWNYACGWQWNLVEKHFQALHFWP